MDERTLTALKGSIKHWQENVEAETINDASTEADKCALCADFFPDYGDQEDCKGCPVANKTGFKYCMRTPYIDAAKAYNAWREGGSRETFTKAAQAELDFLISLLPEGETVE